MSVKHEQTIKLNPEIKIKVEKNDDDNTEIRDKKEVVNIITSEPEPVVEERPIFLCKNCGMTERYDFFGDHVPFNRYVRTKVDYYLARDPFSPRNKKQFLILGSVCSICDKDVCIKSECSLFYSKFFCSVCARKNMTDFPPSIQTKIKSANRI